LALKGNQPALLEDVRLWLDDPATAPDDACQTVDGDHGRIETRRATVVHDVAWLEHHRFPGLAAVAKVTAVRELGGKTTTASRYYLLSKPLAAARLAQVVRAHWQIENRLHWVLDVVMDEARRGHGRGSLARPQGPRPGQPRPTATLRPQPPARQSRSRLDPRQDQARRLG
jgi:predicted transposase YbfD/YdcC